MTVAKQKCARKDCNNDGFLSFRGRPDLKFCQGCYQLLARKIGRIDSEMRRQREIRSNEADDNKPARQPAGY